ncbi:MAG: hypothetical protein E5V48_02525 [Mesorhizobium sp.]|nr:MAG: hypothetical protein E5V48_02525 [Mesorhizobium sp.]
MKVQHRKPLPERAALGSHRYDVVVLRVGKRTEQAVEIAIKAQAESETIRQFCKIPARLSNPHPAVLEIMSDRIRWSSNPQLNALLSGPPSACARRGFLIADVIAKTAVANGFDVQPLQDGGLALSSIYRKTHIRVRERLQLSSDRSTLSRTGFLEIQVNGSRRSFEPKNDLEQYLPSLFARLLTDRSQDETDFEQAKEREARRRVEAEIREDKRKVEAQEARAFAELLLMTSRWTVAAQARTFLAAIRARGPEPRFHDLLEWLSLKVESEDPLDKGPDLILQRLLNAKSGKSGE